MNLQEWAEAYLKYKDSVRRRIESINVDGNKVLVKNRDGSKHVYLCVADLDKIEVESAKAYRVVCLNKRRNIDWLLNNWKTLKDFDTLFIFVNVDKSESWSIHPRNHHNISEEGSLKQGVLSLFESVPEV